MSSTDALLSLRQAIKAKETITYAGSNGPCSALLNATHLVLSSVSLPKSSPTRYLKTGVTNAASPSDFFSLEAVYLAWLLRDAGGAEYMKQARENVSLGNTADSTTPPGSPPRPANASTLAPRKAHADSMTSSPSKRRYIADALDVEVVKKIRQSEVELRDRNTVLRGIKPNNFSSIRTVYAEKLKKMKEASKNGNTAPPVMSTADAKMQARKARNNYPIIMISSSPTALITMHNVKRFLQESTFEQSQDARARAAAEGNTRPEDMIPIYRKRTHIDSGGKETETHARYYVVDSVEALSKFGADAWDRVVCVMTTGQAWQFRPYKWNEPIQLFHHGIYVSWANDPPNAKIKDWNVMELKVNHNV
ncbi:hypothetical protein C0993_007761 [Termitomyces sp. T159_Od127]|nr:hypothetical protein C0993_007761 [Termitomyces sp. T159_Od127]